MKTVYINKVKCWYLVYATTYCQYCWARIKIFICICLFMCTWLTVVYITMFIAIWRAILMYFRSSTCGRLFDIYYFPWMKFPYFLRWLNVLLPEAEICLVKWCALLIYWLNFMQNIVRMQYIRSNTRKRSHHCISELVFLLYASNEVPEQLQSSACRFIFNDL